MTDPEAIAELKERARMCRSHHYERDVCEHAISAIETLAKVRAVVDTFDSTPTARAGACFIQICELVKP